MLACAMFHQLSAQIRVWPPHVSQTFFVAWSHIPPINNTHNEHAHTMPTHTHAHTWRRSSGASSSATSSGASSSEQESAAMASTSTTTEQPVSSSKWRVGLPSPRSSSFQGPVSAAPLSSRARHTSWGDCRRPSSPASTLHPHRRLACRLCASRPSRVSSICRVEQQYCSSNR